MVDYQSILADIQEVYLSDTIPWVIGFSGGKDSTTVLQMVFYALAGLPAAKLSKEVHVLSNDTLVENPAIAHYVKGQLGKIELAGKHRLFRHSPELFSVVTVTPTLEDSFWVNLIGKGYPSPNRWFRWCTERLKINPTSRYITQTVSKSGQAIVVLGTRAAESGNRAASMINYNAGQRLRKHTLVNAFVYAPIANLSNHEVWAYLLQAPNAWGADNRGLLSLYGNACSGGECPFVIETGTQSCGRSRFGCWVCTVVDRDRSMENFIDNGEVWMEALLKFRDWLWAIRQQGSQYVPSHLDGRAKFGPFLLRTRREILHRLLSMQDELHVELIADCEVNHIREILERESAGEVDGGLKQFRLELPNAGCVVAISDFDVLRTPRKRLGPLHLKLAKLIDVRSAPPRRLQSTRVLYYLE
jgi:DNA sulfur modification protein DndC